MNRIRETWKQLRESGRKALIPYFTPEYPFAGITGSLLLRLSAAGADMIEMGIPFSDPLADGATIQHSSSVALHHGVTIDGLLQAVRSFRQRSETPVILMGYYNPILQYGVRRFVHAAARSGVDGLIVADLPPEESSELRRESTGAHVSNIFLIAPTTPRERIRMIDTISTDCSYCVSVTGVTGARTGSRQNGVLAEFLDRVRQATTKPFVVGFGLATAEHVREVWNHADGAVVGSALIQAMDHAQSMEAAVDSAESFFRSLRGGL